MRSFINATMISEQLCSSRRDAQELLPELVAKLIKATVPERAIRDFRFPTGDQVYLHGADGVLAIDDAMHRYVPSGLSLWEMSTEAPPQSKANDDFKGAEAKLSNAFQNITPPVTPDQATFIFVSSSPFQDQEKWISEKRHDSKWKAIKVIDAVSLADWLEQCPAVMLWFAEICGLPAKGLYDPEQYLRKLSIGFRVTLFPPVLIIAGRTEDIERVNKFIVETNVEAHIRAESVDEAAAFIAAVSLVEPDKYANKPPLIFADSQANLNALACCAAELTLIPLDSDAMERAKAIVGHKWRLVIPEVVTLRPDKNPKEAVTLTGCKREAIERLLMEKMEFPEHKARQTARDTKGSLIALLWLIGSGPIGKPRWASRKDATTHASLMLAGAWIGNNENDIKIVERLSRKDYRDVETLLQSAKLPEGPWIHRGVEWLCVSRDFVWSQLADNLTETMLADFRKIVSEVVAEKDPSLDLAPSHRSMASILGKERKYSSTLRSALVDSVARLAILKTDGQSWSDQIVHELLDPTAPDVLSRWLSLRDVYSEIAEASPDEFLDCLDAVLRLGKANEFFQDGSDSTFLFGPTSAHVYLIWALERLAWQKKYLTRVLNELARLAEIDPGGRVSPRPQESIITILLPWKPQHTASMENAAQALKMLYSCAPTITWEVASSLLPTSHSVAFPTPTPIYREHAGELNVTFKEYWDFISAVLQMMIEWADSDLIRWASLIKSYPEIRRQHPDIGQIITDTLCQLDFIKATDENKAVLYDTLKELIAHHREYQDTDWALPSPDLDLLHNLQKKFQPTDLVLLYRHLFSWNPNLPDAPMKKYKDGWDEWITEQRSNAVQVVYGQDGLDGIYRLIDISQVPDYVGQATAKIEKMTEEDIIQFIDKGLKDDPDYYSKRPLTRAVRSYILAKFRMEGNKWVDRVLELPNIKWTEEAYANLALGLQPSPELWKRLELWGSEADRLYWQNIEIWGAMYEHWEHVLAKWKELNRPWSSLEFLSNLIDEHHTDNKYTKPSPEDIIYVLEQALATDESVEPYHQQGPMLTHYTESLFLYLDSQSVDQKKLARLEWGWLRVLKHTKRGTKTLQAHVTSSPELFVDLLKSLYRADDEPKGKNVSKDQERIASQAWHLLESIHTLPGCSSTSNLDTEDVSSLREWVLQTRELAKDAKRLDVCDSHIGRLLSYSPPAPDGSWPCIEVRNLIEELHSPKVDNGFQIGKYNQRGVIARDKGGKQEWELAQRYKRLADMIRTGWPRTASILDDLAKHYENEAKYWDEQEKRDEYQ